MSELYLTSISYLPPLSMNSTLLHSGIYLPPLSLQLFAKLRVDVHFCACEHYYTACATLTPTITLQPAIGASATILVSAVLTLSLVFCLYVCHLEHGHIL